MSFLCSASVAGPWPSMVQLPLTGFNFLDSIPALVNKVNFEKVKEKSRRGLIMSCLILIIRPGIILAAVIIFKLRWPNTVFKCLCLIHHNF